MASPAGYRREPSFLPSGDRPCRELGPAPRPMALALEIELWALLMLVRVLTDGRRFQAGGGDSGSGESWRKRVLGEVGE
jgi:hypothetical protein